VIPFGSVSRDRYGDFQIETFWEQGNNLFKVLISDKIIT